MVEKETVNGMNEVESGGGKKKVIVIDDEETVRIMTTASLGSDYDVTTAGSGQAALNLFLQGYVPDLVILDLNMPEMDGWETFTRIRDISRLRKTPIAIYSTSEDPKDKARAKELGAADYIHKPAKKPELLLRAGKLV
jgi:CheY-like chemotaxis protein